MTRAFRREAAALRAVAAAVLLGAGAAACGEFATAPQPTRAPVGDIDLSSVTQPPRPPEVIARSSEEIAEAVAATSPERLQDLAGRAGAKRYEGPQVPLLFESRLGRAYLSASGGRALAQGAPSRSCPMTGAAYGRSSVAAAVAEALEHCLEQGRRLGAPEDCGCRVIAAGGALLAEDADLAYARAVAARLIDPASGVEIAVIAEERMAAEEAAEPQTLSEAEKRALSEGARTVWLLAPSGPVGLLELAADRSADLRLLDGPDSALRETRRYSGAWRAEGFRRGRLAKRVALRAADGRRELHLLIGYEPAEYDEREAELRAAVAALAVETAALAARPGAEDSGG
ncbi:MAG: hypothetical protein AAFR16_01455 [Pseudomonadota bacterium]